MIDATGGRALSSSATDMTFQSRTFPPSRRLGVRCLAALIAMTMAGACTTGPPTVLIALPQPTALPASIASTATTAAATAAAPGGVLLVRRLVIPEYMAARRVRYWADDAIVGEWPGTYWAERIEIGMAREFVSALRVRLPGWTVCDATCGDIPADVTLKAELLRLDMLRRSGRLVAKAELRITGPRPAAPVAADAVRQVPEMSLPVGADSAQGQAQAMTALLQQVAQTAADAVRQVRAAPATAR